jgi:SAM-dependent methyltransferase
MTGKRRDGDFAKVIRDVHDAIAPEYGIRSPSGDILPFHRWLFSLTVEEKIPHLSKGLNVSSLVVEAGCGNALISQAYINHGIKRLVGLDFSLSMLNNARIRASVNSFSKHFFPVQGNLYDIPLQEGIADYVYVYGVMEHLDDPGGVISEMFRILKPGGRMCLGIPIKWSLAHLTYVTLGMSVPKWKTRRAKFDFNFHDKVKYYRFYSLKQVEELLGQSLRGWRWVSTKPICYGYLAGRAEWILRTIHHHFGDRGMDLWEHTLSKMYPYPTGAYVVIEKL